MSKTPNYDAKVKAILDATQPGERMCALTGEKWNMTEEEILLYKKFNVPPSSLSPNMRWKWLGYYDVGYQFWWNKHFDTGAPVLSYHHPASGVRVLPDTEWHNRDFSSINQMYQPDQPFFAQMRELQKQVPLFATFNVVPPENSLALMSFGDKDSYFVFACKSIASYYSAGGFNMENSSLVFLSNHIRDSHHILHSQRIHRCKYVRESWDCMDSAFLFDCRNCEFCFGATNKRNRKYVFFNEQLSREEYERRVSAIDLGKRNEVEKWTSAFEKLLLENTVWPENFNVSSEASSGDYLNGAVRCKDCFDAEDTAVDNVHSAWLYGNTQGNFDVWGGLSCTDCYCLVSSPDSNQSKFCYRSFRCDNCEYCFACSDCKDCFGCIGLRHKRFCILNTQYTEEEYWQKLDEIKTRMLEQGEYGNYFPTTMSTSYVPESGAVLYAGASLEDIAHIGGNRFDPNAEGATGLERVDLSKARRCEEIPDSIDELSDDWAGVPLFDETAKRTFSFLKPEIAHYRALRIAPPAEHFIRRLQGVSAVGQKARFEQHSCAACQKSVLVSGNDRYPERKIYCRDDYLKYLEQYG